MRATRSAFVMPPLRGADVAKEPLEFSTNPLKPFAECEEKEK